MASIRRPALVALALLMWAVALRNLFVEEVVMRPPKFLPSPIYRMEALQVKEAAGSPRNQATDHHCYRDLKFFVVGWETARDYRNIIPRCHLYIPSVAPYQNRGPQVFFYMFDDGIRGE